MLITVFTPTYNRAELLSALYRSLCRQTFSDFEWLIVDDGSEDNTQKVVETFIEEHKISVRYIRQENKGKHVAINLGANNAHGELFFIVDSDDSLPDNSLEIINSFYSQVRADASFGGVCGYMSHHDGTVIGHGNEEDVLDANSSELRYKYRIVGDMAEIFRTEVIRKFPFPMIKGEKFCPEALIWNRISKEYRLRIFKKVIYYRDYLQGGLTSKMTQIRMKSPVASMMCYAEMNALNIPVKDKVRAAVNYWRFWFCSRVADKPEIGKAWRWAKPLGWMMHRRDLMRCGE
ncbi:MULTISPECIES: glycosyltransferase family 2 protein [Prevotellaceae]|uniref:glycosyltransferase family 2 protein n=1 Tax=Prevotellaceae TaxID=171552 RepID=UPI0003D34212|nr:glycosyltransferase family A protein [Prevotella phocaeensis]ETD21583.1 hypothetical protein HMPREF1199_00658 [Hoylesella oralis CC98A]